MRTGSFAKAESNVRVNTFQSDLNFFGASLAGMLGKHQLEQTLNKSWKSVMQATLKNGIHLREKLRFFIYISKSLKEQNTRLKIIMNI